MKIKLQINLEWEVKPEELEMYNASDIKTAARQQKKHISILPIPYLSYLVEHKTITSYEVWGEE